MRLQNGDCEMKLKFMIEDKENLWCITFLCISLIIAFLCNILFGFAVVCLMIISAIFIYLKFGGGYIERGEE